MRWKLFSRARVSYTVRHCETFPVLRVAKGQPASFRDEMAHRGSVCFPHQLGGYTHDAFVHCQQAVCEIQHSGRCRGVSIVLPDFIDHAMHPPNIPRRRDRVHQSHFRIGRRVHNGSQRQITIRLFAPRRRSWHRHSWTRKRVGVLLYFSGIWNRQRYGHGVGDLGPGRFQGLHRLKSVGP
ncbi:hypothetical protein CPB86DRAFT_185279 [Serendipita vermifera]|nr:hypothetical protein CPB86DRAFT_185279 [Serendipita vermifera]